MQNKKKKKFKAMNRHYCLQNSVNILWSQMQKGFKGNFLKIKLKNP